jgi:hypothetical protein
LGGSEVITKHQISSLKRTMIRILVNYKVQY